jgi:hypothetical protein
MEFQNRERNLKFLLPILWLSLDLEADSNCGKFQDQCPLSISMTNTNGSETLVLF